MSFKPEIDPKSGKIGEPIALRGEPEFLAADAAGMVYINLMDTPTRARRLYARDRRDFGPDAFAKIGQFRSMAPGAAAIDSENQEPLDFEAGIEKTKPSASPTVLKQSHRVRHKTDSSG